MSKANKSTQKSSAISGQKSATRKARKNGKQSRKDIVRKPVPVSTSMVVRQSNFRNKSNYTVPNREYICDINSSTAPFVLSKSLILNPGDKDTFPWGSAFGNLYESYRFKRLRFCYEPSCPTSTAGYIALVPDFNPLEPAPLNKQQAFQNEKTVRGSPFTSFSFSCNNEQLNKRKSYFARSNSETVADANKEVYDTGNLFIFVGGQSADNVVLGEIWVEYDVEFMTPEAPTQVPLTLGYFTPSGTSLGNPLGFGDPLAQVQSTLQDVATFTGGGASTITFLKPFQGILSAALNGTSLGALAATAGSGASLAKTAFGDLMPSLATTSGPLSIMNQFINAPVGGTVGISIPSGVSFLGASMTLLSMASPSLFLSGV